MAVSIETFVCPECGVTATQKSKNVEGNRKKGAVGPFCSRACAGKYAMSRRWKDLPIMETFVCPVCGEEGEKRASIIRANRKAGKAGPFCGKRCAGIYASAVRNNKLDDLRKWAVNVPAPDNLDITKET